LQRPPNDVSLLPIVPTSFRLVWIAFPALVACGARTTLDVFEGSQLSAGAGGGGNEPAGSFDASQVAAAQAACSAGQFGSMDSNLTQNDVKGLAAGSWFLCTMSSSPDAAGTLFSPGITLTPDGHFHRLNWDSSGGLVQGMGARNEGTWSVECQVTSSFPENKPCPVGGIDIRMVTEGGGTDPANCAGGQIFFESGPRRMNILNDQTFCNDDAQVDWLVSL
jgi:hypothetical protein